MAAEEAKPWLHELTAADLYAHCRIADERRAIDVTASYSAWLPYTVRPPREASNEDLDALKPLSRTRVSDWPPAARIGSLY